MSDLTKGDPKKRRPAQRVDLGASSGPAPWLDDSALVKALRRAEQRELEALAEIDELRAALRQIKAVAGRVCEDFAMCKHPACQSSYAAWSLADEALAASDKSQSPVHNRPTGSPAAGVD